MQWRRQAGLAVIAAFVIVPVCLCHRLWTHTHTHTHPHSPTQSQSDQWNQSNSATSHLPPEKVGDVEAVRVESWSPGNELGFTVWTLDVSSYSHFNFKPTWMEMIKAAWKEITLGNRQMCHVGTQFVVVAIVRDVQMKWEFRVPTLS